MGPEPAALLDHPPGHEVGVPVLLGDVMIDVPKGILQRGLRQVSDSSITVEALVHKVLPIAQPILSEELWLTVIGIPATMPDPATEEKVLPRDEIRIGRIGLGQDLANLFPQPRRHPLIRI